MCTSLHRLLFVYCFLSLHNGLSLARQTFYRRDDESPNTVTGTMDLDPTITPNPKAWFNVPDAWKDVPGVFTAAFEASKAMKDITNKSLSSWCSLSKLSSYVDVIVTQGLDKSHWDYQWNYPPCCGPCFVDAQTAELIFFPTKGVKDGQGIVSGDYTFVAPSAYVGFKYLYAGDRCNNQLTDNNDVFGTPAQHTTIAVDPAGISRLWFEPIGPITDYFDLHSSAMDYDELAKCFTDPSRNLKTLEEGDACRPFINLPVEVTNLQPEWKTCTQWIHGVIDPPVALTQASPLAPTPPSDPTPPPVLPASPPKPADPPAPTPPPSAPAPADPPSPPSPAPADPPANNPPANNPPAPAPASPPAHNNNPPSPAPAPAPPPAPAPAPSFPLDPDHPKDPPVTPQKPDPPVTPQKPDPPAPAPAAPKPPIVVAHHTIKRPSKPSPSSIKIGTHVVQAGGPAVTISNTPVSLAPSGVLVVDHKSIDLAPSPTPAKVSKPKEGVVVAGDQAPAPAPATPQDKGNSNAEEKPSSDTGNGGGSGADNTDVNVGGNQPEPANDTSPPDSEGRSITSPAISFPTQTGGANDNVGSIIIDMWKGSSILAPDSPSSPSDSPAPSSTPSPPSEPTSTTPKEIGGGLGDVGDIGGSKTGVEGSLQTAAASVVDSVMIRVLMGVGLVFGVVFGL